MDKRLLLRKGWFIALITSGTAAQAQAQTEPMVTDRPDQTESALSVPRGRFQIETGITNSGKTTYQYPTTLLRYGLGSGWELRGAGQLITTNSVTALDDVELGFKHTFFRESESLRGMPNIGILAHWVVKPDRIDVRSFNMRVSVEKSLTESLGMGCNLGWTVDEGISGWVYTLTLGYELIDGLTAYLESYGTEADHHIDGGFTYSPLPLLQFDLSASRGLNNEEYYIAGGLSVAL